MTGLLTYSHRRSYLTCVCVCCYEGKEKKDVKPHIIRAVSSCYPSPLCCVAALLWPCPRNAPRRLPCHVRSTGYLLGRPRPLGERPISRETHTHRHTPIPTPTTHIPACGHYEISLLSATRDFLAPLPARRGDMGKRDPVTGSQVSGWGNGEAAHVVQACILPDGPFWEPLSGMACSRDPDLHLAVRSCSGQE